VPHLVDGKSAGSLRFLSFQVSIWFCYFRIILQIWIFNSHYPFFLLVTWWLQLKRVSKLGSLLKLRFTPDLSAHESSNHLADVQAQSDPLGIQILWSIKKAKKAEQVLLVLFRNADPRILNRYLNKLRPRSFWSSQLAFYRNLAVGWRKFEGVRQ